MPSTPLRPRPSLQYLNGNNESQPGSQHAPIPSKSYVQGYAVHKRDAPMNGIPNFPIRDPRLPPGSSVPSPGFRMDDGALPVPDPSQLPKTTAGSHRSSINGTHKPPEVDNLSDTSSTKSFGTREPAARELPPLQAQSTLDEFDQMRPLSGDLLGSFDLVAPPEQSYQPFSLEIRAEQLFSRQHLQVIFSNPTLLLRFTAFLSTHRPGSVPVLIYYLDALKALRAIRYANAVAEALSPIRGHAFTASPVQPTTNTVLEEKAAQAFDALVEDDLPAYITHMYIQVVSLSICQRITGTLAPHLREASEGLAECFVVTDVTRPDNPIVFASEEFNRTTQYGMSYVIGRNCRFLQGPRTNRSSVRRIRDATMAGREHCEVFLNYRRDGSPFVNLLMIAPLCDSRGQIRYHIGAQVDVSGLVKDCTDLESFQQLVMDQSNRQTPNGSGVDEAQKKDEFQELSEMLNMGELETVRRFGGKMHRESYEEDDDVSRNGAPHRPRLLLKETTADHGLPSALGGRMSGKLGGIFQHYLLIRPYPSLRILFASPTLRVPGILQSPFMNKIGGSPRVRDELTSALAEGRGVTAKVRWVSRADEDGRNRWIHCTPLVGSNGQIGVWMVVLVDDDQGLSRRWKQAPPVGPHRGKVYGDRSGMPDEYTIGGGSRSGSIRADYIGSHQHNHRHSGQSGSLRSSSPNSKLTQSLLMVIILMLVAFFYNIAVPAESSKGPRTGGFEDTIISFPSRVGPVASRHKHSEYDDQPAAQRARVTMFVPGSPEPRSIYSRVMVIPRMQEDDITWISRELPGLDVFVYVANDPSASSHPPKNKGHEVMIYLTYLIDNYEHLPDIVLFMHSHRWTHHNNGFLGFDASQMIRALNGAHVMRAGYVNMRCHWSPGCPEWLHPSGLQDSLAKQEERVLAQSWRELFPFDPLPSFLAQPCCAQFALSKDRILSVPRSRYVFYRDWIMRTPLSDYISGRIWEYSWQYLFTQNAAQCPAEHICYCDGFGICFGGQVPYGQYVELLGSKTRINEELNLLELNRRVVQGPNNSTSDFNQTDTKTRLRAQLAQVEAELDSRKQQALQRGTNPKLRAEECGRPWREGDGF
ncbi:MAG: hypothetical protein Q9213_005058 [Squamulea squamosa]